MLNCISHDAIPKQACHLFECKYRCSDRMLVFSVCRLYEDASRCKFKSILTMNDTKTQKSHQVLFWSDRRRAQRWLCNFWIKEVMYPHSCQSAWLQQWPGADLHCRGNTLYFMNATLPRGEREPEPEPESLLSADFTQSFTSKTLTVARVF